MANWRVAAFALISALAPMQAGATVVISTSPTSNMSCSAGVCTPTAKNAVLNASDLAGMLGSGDVAVETGKHAGTLIVAASISWTSASRLTLDSKTDVGIKAPLVVAGNGALTVVTNDGGTGGNLLFSTKGHVDFWDPSSSLVIDAKPYTLVGNIAGLASGIASTPGGNFALANDYDAKPDGAYTASPIPTPFGGTFEGLGHVISRLKLTQKQRGQNEVALFNGVASTGTVRDIGIAQSNVAGGRSEFDDLLAFLAAVNSGRILHSYAEGVIKADGDIAFEVGGLVSYNSGTISDCHAGGTIEGNSPYMSAGGLVYQNDGVVTDSYATTKIDISGDAGGLVYFSDGTISNSHASGPINAYMSAGGLINLNRGTITTSYATNNVISTGGYAGGLAENVLLPGIIDRSYATGNVSGEGGGGLVGGANGGTIQNSYATGTITASRTADTSAGGLIGALAAQDSDVTVQNSYSTGAPSGAGLNGGSIGNDATPSGGIASVYWDMDTSGITNPSQGAAQPLNDPGITGLSDAALKSGLPAGFDPAIWGQSLSINNGYPYLLALPPK